MVVLESDDRAAEGAGDFVVRRDSDRATGDLLEGGDDGAVEGGAALEEDAVADALAADDAVEIVVDDRVGEARDEVLDGRAGLLLAGELGLHENGAALAEVGRLARLEGEVGELALDGDAEALGLLFEKGPGAGGADLVHLEVDDVAVVEGDELGVLAADLEDGVHRRDRSRGRREPGR